ncbi:MAG: tyrosine-type recombinase/integrase, partial [Alphaproteobacteria bacterium]|nr:tyrosine-type recombinase/integrase [Alphaproteobacteria bacterium]
MWELSISVAPARSGKLREVPKTPREPQPTREREDRREWLTEAEVERLCATARKRGRGHRDATMILIACRQGLRVSQLVALRWQYLDLETGRLRVIRSKARATACSRSRCRNSRVAAHQARAASSRRASARVFVSERGAPLTADGF